MEIEKSFPKSTKHAPWVGLHARKDRIFILWWRFYSKPNGIPALRRRLFEPLLDNLDVERLLKQHETWRGRKYGWFFFVSSFLVFLSADSRSDHFRFHDVGPTFLSFFLIIIMTIKSNIECWVLCLCAGENIIL